jgi:MYXO-CTERM domain-containing protein
MRKPFGRLTRGPYRLAPLLAPALASVGFAGCGSGGAEARAGDARPELRSSSAALVASSTSIETAPAAVAFDLALDGQRFTLSLQRSEPPTASGYQALRRTRSGQLIPLAPPEPGCTYRGVTEAADATTAAPGFASMSVCSSTTGRAAGQAARGFIRAGGRFFRIWPDPADADASDGLDHFAQALHRGDAQAAPEPVQRTTLVPLPVSPVARLPFREGTEAETKYLDLVMVSDAARVAELGGATEASTIQFVDTMNALLEGSGLSPRLRVTLRAQVLFEEDPYAPTFVGGEVDNDSLLNEFLAWGQAEELPVHDEHVLLSGLDFVGGVVGYAGLDVACTSNANGAIVQAGDASGGFAVLSAVHELGHTLGMNHDDGSQQGCPEQGFIMAAVGCGNCGGAEEAEFSPCSIAEFQSFLAGPAYAGALCADDVPSGTAPSCGDGAVQAGETCDCGSGDCGDIDPCCNGATCQLQEGAECSDYNDGCCQGCAIVGADAGLTCRARRSECDIEEVCNGASKDCPADAFEAAGDPCQDDSGNQGLCYFGDCRSRGTQCEQIDEQQQATAFDGIGEPGEGCELGCDTVVCSTGRNGCLFIDGPTVNDGVRCENGGQCVGGQCVSTVDQCPADPGKIEPGDCGCGQPDTDSDGDDRADCVDGCPADGDKQSSGACGCGEPDVDGDADGSPDCIDECPSDPAKREAGDCGCGEPETDGDGDGVADCADECPDNSFYSRAGACGCGQPELDADFDGTPDCVDLCPADGERTAPPCSSPRGAQSERSSDDGCSLVGAGSERGSIGPLGWLGLVLVPVLRRRRR